VATIDFLLSAKRDAAVTERFLIKALGGENHPAPRVINTDKHAATLLIRQPSLSSKPAEFWKKRYSSIGAVP
jgi:transposase-like protein